MARHLFQSDHFQIIRNKHLPGIDALSLCGIVLLTRFKGFLFGMIKDEMTGTKLLSIACGIKRGTVMLFIGLETVTISIKTKGLAHQPIGMLSVGTTGLVEWLIA